MYQDYIDNIILCITFFDNRGGNGEREEQNEYFSN